MDNFLIKDKSYHPFVFFNKSNGVFEISGDSSMEHPFHFYAPIINWLDSFFRSNKTKVQFNFNLQYYNTGSSRALFDLFSLLEKQGDQVIINWFAEPMNIDVIEDGEIFQEDFPDLYFNILIREKAN